MRKERSQTDRWEWYGRGDPRLDGRLARGTQSPSSDNSPEQVVWECGLVVVVPLAIAVLVEVAMRMSGA